MRDIPNPPIIAAGVILILGIIGGTALIACSKVEDSKPQAELAVEKVVTSGTSPVLYATCFRGAVILMTGGGHAMVQLLDPSGKPKECN